MGVGRIKKQVTLIIYNRNVIDNSYRTKRTQLNLALHIHASSCIGFSIIIFSKKDVPNLTLASHSLGSLEKK